jgi:hypothetical protein
MKKYLAAAPLAAVVGVAGFALVMVVVDGGWKGFGILVGTTVFAIWLVAGAVWLGKNT